MASNDEGFAARWSRLKRASAAERAREKAAVAPPEEAGDAPPDPAGDGEDAAAVADLPPIDSLDRDSDFTKFMRKGVPEELKRLALRKLWTSDPVLANLDGLLEYGEDFNKPSQAARAVETLYRVGRGMPDPVKEVVQQATEDDGEPAQVASVGEQDETAPTPEDSPDTGQAVVDDEEDGAATHVRK